MTLSPQRTSQSITKRKYKKHDACLTVLVLRSNLGVKARREEECNTVAVTSRLVHDSVDSGPQVVVRPAKGHHRQFAGHRDICDESHVVNKADFPRYHAHSVQHVLVAGRE